MAIRARRVVGVVTVADFMRAADLDEHAGFATKLRVFLKEEADGAASDYII